MKGFLSMLLICLSVFLSGARADKRPVAFYLKNLPAERIGGDSDAEIRHGLQEQGFIVIDVDCSVFPKTSPQLEEALVQFHIDSPEILNHYEDADDKSVFYVPEGYTVTRNIPVWNILEHGAEGSAEWVMETWNSHVVTNYGRNPVLSPDRMTTPEGTPLDWNLYMDIVHPSGHASKDVPLLMVFGSSSPRMSSFRPTDRRKDRLYRNIFPLGFLTTGYAFAITDHCYNPIVPSWGHFKQYTLDDYNGLAASTAFVRYVRAHSDRFNLNGKIGVMGLSKASYSAVRVADRANAGGEEFLLFGGVRNDKPQPCQGVPSHVNVAYVSAGIGAERIPLFVNENTVPLVTSAGKHDEYGQWDVYPYITGYLHAEGYPHLSFPMEDMGHTFPCMGTDKDSGENRYVLFKRFFDLYLKGGKAESLYSSDKDRMLPHGLPENMKPHALHGFDHACPFAEAYAGMGVRTATGERKFVIFKYFQDYYVGKASSGNHVVTINLYKD